MYKKCIKCPKVGVSCEGPHFFTMSGEELLEWCKERKKFLKLSNEKLSELTYLLQGTILSGIPKGTIDRLFSGEHIDFKYETMRPIIMVLAGGEFVEAPCPDEPDNFVDEKIVHLEEENEKLKKEINELKEANDEKLNNYKEKLDIYKDQLKWVRISSAILGVLLAVCLVIITVALVVDHFHSDLGFFWVS